MPVCAIVSFRLGLSDGVSIVAESWRRALTELGFDVMTVAGEGPVDHLLPGLAIGAPVPPEEADLAAALAGADLVVVENLCTIPLNLPATRVVGRLLAGRPAVLHHHDPPWQLPHHAHVTELPLHDPAWRHVVINEHTRRELADRGIHATTIYNGFDPNPPAGDRQATRAALGIADHDLVVMHPVRAIPRKNVPAAVRLSEDLDATYWLLGPAEDGYGPQLDAIVAAARCRVIHTPSPGTMHDAYAAADLVAFPSIREGFGNPPVEAALHHRPAVVGHYAVAEELRAFGFRWFDLADVEAIRRYLREPDLDLLEHNRRIAAEHFSQQRVVADVRQLLREAGWLS